MQLARREALLGSMLAVSAATAWPTTTRAADPSARLSALEQTHGGRLGVSAVALESGRHIGHRADERFLMCSTITNDAGFVWTRDRGPILAAACCEMPSASSRDRDAVLAEVGRIVAEL